MNINGQFNTADFLSDRLQRSNDDKLKQLASAKRINSAADDAAGLQIANRLTSQNSSTRQTETNLYDGLSLANLADQSLQGVTDGLNEIGRLAAQAGSGILNADDKAALQKQVNAISAGIKDQIANTEFAGTKLFSANGSIALGGEKAQLSLKTTDLTKQLADGGVFAIDLTQADGVEKALAAVKSTTAQIDNQRTDIGATANALTSAARNLSNQNVNEQAAISRIADLDYAKASTELIQGQIREQASIAVAAQGRVQSEQALQLLN
jgi:flagellin